MEENTHLTNEVIYTIFVSLKQILMKKWVDK